jgi:hypothetical protein
MDQIPVGKSLFDLEGRLPYDDACCARLVDRHLAQIGTDIRCCHRKAENVALIDGVLATLRAGTIREHRLRVHAQGSNLAGNDLALGIRGLIDGLHPDHYAQIVTNATCQSDGATQYYECRDCICGAAEGYRSFRAIRRPGKTNLAHKEYALER